MNKLHNPKQNLVRGTKS